MHPSKESSCDSSSLFSRSSYSLLRSRRQRSMRNSWSTPRNVRFVGFSGQVAWNSVYSGGAYAFTVAYQRVGGAVVEADVRGGLLSFAIPEFRSVGAVATCVSAFICQALPRLQSRFSRWVEWVVPTPTPTPVTPTATPTPVTPTGTPSGSYRSTYYENRTVYEAESCADRREFRRCRQTCLRADPANCWDLTCGSWLVGVAAPPSCATPVGAPTATATANAIGFGDMRKQGDQRRQWLQLRVHVAQ